MEIGRHAVEVVDRQSSIQLLQMPWNNISSRHTSRQTSQDPQNRPPSRDSMHSGGGGFRSSVSRGFGEDIDFGPPYSPAQHLVHVGVNSIPPSCSCADVRRNV
jgi:hypothetical protein